MSLSSRVEPEMFQILLHGFSPEGQALFGRSVSAAKRRAATDYTFSAPKSVSIAALVQQDERVLQAHQRAIEQALSILEECYAQTRVSTLTGRQYTAIALILVAGSGYVKQMERSHGKAKAIVYVRQTAKAASLNIQEQLSIRTRQKEKAMES